MMYRIEVEEFGTVFTTGSFSQAENKYDYYVALGGNVTLYYKDASGAEEIISYSKEQ